MTAPTLRLTRAIKRAGTRLHVGRLKAKLAASEHRRQAAWDVHAEAVTEAKIARRRAAVADREHFKLARAIRAELEVLGYE
jgi:hypothetical protein